MKKELTYNMKTSKRIIFFSIGLFIVISFCLFVAVLFKSTVDADFEFFSLLLNPIKIFLLMSVLFMVLLVVINKKQLTDFNVEKIFLAFSVILYLGLFIAGISAFLGYNSRSGVFCSSEISWSDMSVERYLPYNEVFKKNSSDDVYYEVSKTSVDGIVYIHTINDVMNGIDYEAEFFDSSSCLMNYKFVVDRTESNIFNDFDAEVTGNCTTEIIDSIECDVYTEGTNYYLVIVDGKSSFFTSITDNEDVIISFDDFKQNAIEQFRLMKEVINLEKYEL